jgi:hypothetical protein
MWAISRRTVMPKAECFGSSASTYRLEPDYEQACWAAIFTAECGFFSAARLQRLFAPRFAARIEGEGSLAGSPNDDWDAAREGPVRLANCYR